MSALEGLFCLLTGDTRRKDDAVLIGVHTLSCGNSLLGDSERTFAGGRGESMLDRNARCIAEQVYATFERAGVSLASLAAARTAAGRGGGQTADNMLSRGCSSSTILDSLRGVEDEEEEKDVTFEATATLPLAMLIELTLVLKLPAQQNWLRGLTSTCSCCSSRSSSCAVPPEQMSG